METLGYRESLVRLTIDRMVAAGTLESERLGRNAYYSLSALGKARGEFGKGELYPARAPRFDGSWLLVRYSIPEERRAIRDELREYLVFAGFAQFSPSVWIAPGTRGNREEKLRAIEAEFGAIGAAPFCSIHKARFEDDPLALARELWDIEASAKGWRNFIDAWTRRLAEAEKGVPEERAFAVAFELESDWLSRAAVDPRLPIELLPSPWPGVEARALVDSLWALLDGGARNHVRFVIERSGGARP
jgi:phenylacetic acid degradation operon negative regulatory protein